MDQTPSQLPDTAQLIDALRSALKEHSQKPTETQDAQLRDTVEQFLRLLPGPAGPPPRQALRTVVDNSDSTKIQANAINDVDDPSNDESCCSTSTVASPSFEVSLPKWPVLSSMVLPTPMNGRNKSALVIENEKSLSRMFTTFLKADHYLVRTAYKSEEGLRLYRDCAPFEVVLIDYHMPNRNGIDIALDILKHDPTQPMMIITREYQTEDEVPRRKELMNTPFLLDMTKSRFRKVLESLQPWATREEVDRAIEALTKAELLRLRKFADRQANLFRGADDRTGDDLLQEALRSTFQRAEDGQNGRRWNKRVSFATYLFGAIRGISGRRKSDKAVLACDTFKEDAKGQEYCQFDDVTPSERNNFFGYASGDFDLAAEQSLIAKQNIKQIMEEFTDDPVATLVLQGWAEGLKRREILQQGLSGDQYRTAVRRIRKKLLGPTNGGGGKKHDGQD